MALCRVLVSQCSDHRSDCSERERSQISITSIGCAPSNAATCCLDRIVGMRDCGFAALFADSTKTSQRSLCAERLGDGSSRGTSSRGVLGSWQTSAITLADSFVTAPMAPPGWFFLKVLPLFSCSWSATVSASISPMAIWTVVDVVGADTPNDTSSSSNSGAGSNTPLSCSFRRGHSDALECEVRATIWSWRGR